MFSNAIKTAQVFFVLALMKISASALAAPLGSREVKLSVPVGRDILPGGSMADVDIRTGFIFSKLIPFLIRYGLRLAVGIAVIAIIVGGYRFMTSFGDSEKRQAAQKTILYAIIGLIIAIAAFGIVTVISNFSFV